MADPLINPEEIRAQLSEEFGISSLSPEKQEEALEMALGTLFKVIYTESMAKIGEKGMEEYEALMEKSPSDEEVLQFFQSRISGYDAFISGIVQEFKATVKLN